LLPNETVGGGGGIISGCGGDGFGSGVVVVQAIGNASTSSRGNMTLCFIICITPNTFVRRASAARCWFSIMREDRSDSYRVAEKPINQMRFRVGVRFP
jgi:hypothetical protein